MNGVFNAVPVFLNNPNYMNQVFQGRYWAIERYVSGFCNNAFLISCKRTRRSVIIDTPKNPQKLIKAASRYRVEAILFTHGHRDHVEGYETVKNHFPVQTGIGEPDRTSLPDDASVTINVETGNSIIIGDISLTPLFTPGHTPGSTCYLLESEKTLAESEPSHIFTGDTLFPGGPGKSRSNIALKQILKSLESHIFALPEKTVVLPGHGGFTTVGKSKNEYAQFASHPLDDSLYGDVTWIQSS